MRKTRKLVRCTVFFVIEFTTRKVFFAPIKLQPDGRYMKQVARILTDCENGFLKGVHDEQWSTWFTGYVLGRLGDFVSPSSLVVWLESITVEEGWSEAAATLVLKEIMK